MFHFLDERAEAHCTACAVQADPDRGRAGCRVPGCWSLEILLMQNQEDWLWQELGMTQVSIWVMELVGAISR